MYQIKNGKLIKDGKEVFALGESYYPSFHPSKFPVKPEDDRIGEMKKDLRMMAEAGFNHVRLAALGEVAYDADRQICTLNAPFVDEMIREAAQNNLSVSVRLQGFAVNLRNFPDGEMLDAHGNTPAFAWSDFVRTTLHHSGILQDNFGYARDLAKHFAALPSVVGYQIYNEPKFPDPHKIVCDYNPHAVAAYRKWLVAHGVLTAVEAEGYQPPRGLKEQSPRMWALWRLFSAESMAKFLKNASEGAKTGADLPTFTCLTSDTACKTNPRRGVDAFADAKSMDLVGYTIYKHAWGGEYYPMCLDGDTFQSAAEAEGKEAWCIELDSRTYIPSSVYNKGTYATVGAGVKGIIYYQWRGDQPVEGVPHPNSCGLLNSDGTKTANFENALAVNRWLNGVGDLLVNAHRAKEGIGLFYSPYAVAYTDALENNDQSLEYHNTTALYYNQLYADLRRAGYTVTIVDREHLEGIKVLVLADPAHLSPEEWETVEAFYENGGQVFVNYESGKPTKAFCGLSRYDRAEHTYEEKVFLPPYTAWDLPDLTGIRPIAVSLEPGVGVQTLQGEGYILLVLTNTSTVKEQVDARLRVSFPFTRAKCTAIDGEKTVTVNGNELLVPITDGGMIILQ